VSVIGDIFGAVAGVFSGVAGWAVGSVIAAVTSWVLGGVIVLIEALWSVIDMSSNPVVGADWFSGAGSTPFRLAMGIGALMLALTVMAAVIRAVLAGSPGGIAKAVGRDLPAAVFTMIATIGFTDVALQLTNQISLWVWTGTRDDAKTALDTLAVLLRTGMPGSGFLGVALALLLLLAMVFLWVVLYVREALIYLVVVFSAAFAWPLMVFPPLRDTAKKAFELLLALIICKPVITLALAVGVSAMGSINHNSSTSAIGALGTLVAGVIVFGMAAFMPFVVWKLMPLAAAAVVAQGVAGGPARAAQSGMQMQFYGRQLAAGGKVHGQQAATGGSATAGGGGAAAAGPAGAAVAAAQLATAAVRNTARNTAEAAGSAGEG
jgi:type IV secretion system protein TrbL